MRYYINAADGYITSLSTVNLEGDGNATAEEYAEVKAMFDSKPSAESGYDYRLKTDLTWELVELPPIPEDDEATIEDYEAALAELGVSE